MCFCWYQCGKDEVRAPLAWLKTHTERVPTTNAKAIELNSRLCLTVLHGPAWLAPDLCVCVACASVCVCVPCMWVTLCMCVVCSLSRERVWVSERAIEWERDRVTGRVRERARERENEQTRSRARAAACSEYSLLSTLSLWLPNECSVCVCVCVRVYVCICLCVYTWWRETGLLTFLACYFLYKGTHTHTHRHAQTHAAMCLYVQPFQCTY